MFRGGAGDGLSSRYGEPGLVSYCGAEHTYSAFGRPRYEHSWRYWFVISNDGPQNT